MEITDAQSELGPVLKASIGMAVADGEAPIPGSLRRGLLQMWQQITASVRCTEPVSCALPQQVKN